MKELFGELESRWKNRETEFWATARKVAEGERVTSVAVERVLADGGKTPADLKATVELLQRRRQWHEIMSAESTLKKERAALRERIAAEDRKLAAAEKAHTEKTEPIYARLDSLKARVSDASDARRQLIETCPYADLKAELAETQRRLNEQRSRHAVLMQQVGRASEAESDLAEARRHAEGVTPGSDPRLAHEWRDRADRNRRAAERARAELPQVEKEVARLENEEAAIYEQMTKP